MRWARKARFRVIGRLDAASRIQDGTVTVSRATGIFAVRPLRRHREYSLPLSTVAEIVCQKVIRAEAGDEFDGTRASQRRAERRQKRTLTVGQWRRRTAGGSS